jgi:hypothetical protein
MNPMGKYNLIVVSCLFIGCALQPRKETDSKIVEQPAIMSEKPAQGDHELLADDSLENELFGWINGDLVNARIAPTTKSQTVAKLTRGARIKLIELVDEVAINDTPISKWWRCAIFNYSENVYVKSSFVSELRIKSDDVFESFNFDSTSITILENAFKTHLELDVTSTFAGENWTSHGKVDLFVYTGNTPQSRINGISFYDISISAEPDTIPLKLAMIWLETHDNYEKAKEAYIYQNNSLVDRTVDYYGNEWGSVLYDEQNNLYVSIQGLPNQGSSILYFRKIRRN